MYCKCGVWVEVGKGVSSVKCSDCSNPIYNLPLQKHHTPELKINQYYLLIANNGFILQTKFKPEAKIIVKWKGIVFAGITDRAKHSISYEIGETHHIEKLRNIPISQPYHKKLCFDFHNLRNSGHIKNIEVQNNSKTKQQKAENF